jgi:flagella basal body P-ring formation protein FlgA
LLATSSARARAKTVENGGERLVKPGQTAMLTWEQAGIRVVLPVTCLDAGGLGQFVRVRFKNAARTLWAEVIGESTLRASL